eukprot:973845-Alexandrium_andersonii.AAC.1
MAESPGDHYASAEHQRRVRHAPGVWTPPRGLLEPPPPSGGLGGAWTTAPPPGRSPFGAPYASAGVQPPTAGQGAAWTAAPAASAPAPP